MLLIVQTFKDTRTLCLLLIKNGVFQKEYQFVPENPEANI